MENKKILKLCSDKYKDADKIYEKLKKKNELVHNSWWYLDGKLEREFGYDKAFVINDDEIPEYTKDTLYSDNVLNGDPYTGNLLTSIKIEKTKKDLHIDGEVPVEVLGISEPCVGYFWIARERKVIGIFPDGSKTKKYDHWDQRGLVCLKSDKEACEYACKKMKEKSAFI